MLHNMARLGNNSCHFGQEFGWEGDIVVGKNDEFVGFQATLKLDPQTEIFDAGDLQISVNNLLAPACPHRLLGLGKGGDLLGEPGQ